MQEEEPVTNGHNRPATEERKTQRDSSPTMEPPKRPAVLETNGKKPAAVLEHGDPDEDLPPPTFSWLDAHPTIVVIVAGAKGKEQQYFAIQKDFLCAKSSYYRKELRNNEDTVISRDYPEVTPETFGFVQNFLFTGELYQTLEQLPGYEVLIDIWKVGHERCIDGLCDKVLEAMQECRHITQHIPATPLLVKVWNETPEGSPIRTLLLSWAAEYMRSSEERAEFAKSLPQEVLSELVVAISSLGAPNPTIRSSEPPVPPSQSSAVASPVAQPVAPLAPAPASRKNIHYMAAGAEDDDGEYGARAAKKAKRASVGGGSSGQKKSTGKKASTRQPLIKQAKRRSSATNLVPGQDFSVEKKLEFCADLLTRMLSGPGFWTRLVGPFRQPVSPEREGVPDYFDKIKKPMDLTTIKTKMDTGKYSSELEFVSDVRQIFENCFAYWTEDHPMWTTCAKFQKTFEEKYGEMNKWLAKMSGHEMEEQ